MLLITFSFPPDWLVGGLRWQEMSRHFAEHGWLVDVVTRDFSRLSHLDAERLHRLAPGTRIFSVPDGEPLIGRLHQFLLSLVRRYSRGEQPNASNPHGDSRAPSSGPVAQLAKAYLAWLSVRRAAHWAHSASRIARSLTRDADYGIVISSGPPHMAHEAARLLHDRTSLPYVVDMRDPWSLVERRPEELASPLWLFLARRHERAVVTRAALITMNTDNARDAMRTAYPRLADRIETIRNGADDPAAPLQKADGVFRIRFAGSIYLDRDPRLAFRAAARVIHDLQLTPAQFAVEFIGDADPRARKPASEIAVEEGLDKFFRLGTQLPRKEALEFLAGATLLLNLPQDSDLAIPAKIYEYVRMDAWMLVLARRESATARLLEGTDADVVDPTDVNGIARAIRKRVEQFQGGARPVSIGHDGRFDRRVQSEKLLRLIERISAPIGQGSDDNS